MYSPLHLPYSNQMQPLPLPLPQLGDKKTYNMTTAEQQQLMAQFELLSKSGGRDDAPISGEQANYRMLCAIL